MKVSAQYVQEHLDELLDAEPGQEFEIARGGEPAAKLIIMQPHKSSQADERRTGKRIFGAGVGELILPSDEEWKAMDKELEDIMLNGPLFPLEKQ